MIKVLAFMALVNVVGALINMVICLWTHDTQSLTSWGVAFAGWFVALCQLLIRISKGESK